MFKKKKVSQTWGVDHGVSSAYFHQFNGHDEVAVKASKRLPINNVNLSGDLNNDSFVRVLIHLRITHDRDCDMSPLK